jgi:4-amino-4-deoxy-L-arabinose transferase-like glycosyltransferase
LALLTVTTLSIADHDIRWIIGLRPIPGLVLTTLIAAPWFVAIEQATEGRFLAESFWHDLVPKLVGPQESHGAPPGSYLALSLASFWPGSLFLVPAVVWGWLQRSVPAPRFLIAWLFPAWALLELMRTKLPHFVLPLYPALALLAGRALAQGFQFLQPRVCGGSKALSPYCGEQPRSRSLERCSFRLYGSDPKFCRARSLLRGHRSCSLYCCC